jgi:D-tyrosyl-tRNA(Tyr) deacylase
MRVLIQRVTSASVSVEDQVVGSIGRGMLLLVGFGKGDTEKELAPMAEKIVNLRIFPDQDGRFDQSLLNIRGEALAVPQFTLYGETKKGRRPDFFSALEPELAEPLFHRFADELSKIGIQKVEKCSFGAYMQVRLQNDGPVTLLLEV